MLCGADCAEEAEDEFDKELRDFKRDIKKLGDKKDCEKKLCGKKLTRQCSILFEICLLIPEILLFFTSLNSRRR